MTIPSQDHGSTFHTLTHPLEPDRVEPHRVGTPGVLRSLRYFPHRGATVSFAVGGIVLADTDTFADVASTGVGLSVFVSAPGSGRAGRAGPGSGPSGRLVAADDWDGTYDVAQWEGHTVVRVHRRGEPGSIWRWHDGTDWTQDWYGNIEAPWRRTALGFDMQDYALDVTGHGIPGTDSWDVALKDEDELAWFVESGEASRSDADRITAIGDQLLDVFRRGDGALGMDWNRWVPPDTMRPVPLPAGWESIDRA